MKKSDVLESLQDTMDKKAASPEAVRHSGLRIHMADGIGPSASPTRFDAFLRRMSACFLDWYAKWNERFPDVPFAFGLFDPNGVPLSSAGEERQAGGIVEKVVEKCLLSGSEQTALLRSDDPFEETAFNFAFAIPVRSETGMLVAVIGGIGSAAGGWTQAVERVKTIAYSFIVRMESEIRARNDNDRLVAIAQQLHSINDAGMVLGEAANQLRIRYPRADIQLHLSQDEQSLSVPVKLLTLSVGNKLCAEAYRSGELLTEHYGGNMSIAAPLCGNQGVYGVFDIRCASGELDDDDIYFIRKLSGIAGVALENAKLYEQSNQLVSELKLINGLMKRLGECLEPDDIYDTAYRELLHVFGADYCCIAQINDDKRIEVCAGNMERLGGLSLHDNQFLIHQLSRSRKPVIVGNYRAESGYAPSLLMEKAKCQSMIAAPVVAGAQVTGFVLLMHRKPQFFSYSDSRLLEIMCGHIGLAAAKAQLHAQLRQMAITDQLTGLYTRRYLDEQVNLTRKKHRRGSLLVFDIDDFKVVNDTYGHLIGDRVLSQVSRIIRSCIRDSDIAARWGGEELAVYLPEASLKQALHVADRIRNKVFRETEPRVSVSCGVSEWTIQDADICASTLFHRADKALYRAKKAGKNQIFTG